MSKLSEILIEITHNYNLMLCSTGFITQRIILLLLRYTVVTEWLNMWSQEELVWLQWQDSCIGKTLHLKQPLEDKPSKSGEIHHIHNA